MADAMMTNENKSYIDDELGANIFLIMVTYLYKASTLVNKHCANNVPF